jgi:D-3-phosphoglycerate dehydrogenase
VGWTPGVNADSVAEQAIGFMIALCRNLYLTSSQLKQKQWNKSGGIQLTGRTVGVIGVGHIGQKVIKILKAFNCKILANDTADRKSFYKEHGVEAVDKETLLKNVDIVTIHTPLTSETKFMIGEKQLRLMKRTSYLVNTARGPIVEQKALHKALAEKWIAGAALDVYEEEPNFDLDFLGQQNLICTPHIGGNAIEAVHAMGLSAINHLKKQFNR